MIKTWLSAFRLRTLPLAFSCIIMGSGLAFGDDQFNLTVFVLALITTLFLQILSNLANDYGELIIAGLSPAGYTEISRAKLIEPTHQVGGRTLVWSHPAFANRSVYLRNDREIRCYSLAKRPD